MRHEFESPFLDAELSAREAAADREPRTAAIAAESPFVDALMPVAAGAGEDAGAWSSDREHADSSAVDETYERAGDGREKGEGDDANLTTPRMQAEKPAVKPSRVHARILWPALGFPAVISPRSGRAADDPLSDGDATRCITVLLVSDRKNLSKAEAARYLRYTTWGDRERRHIRDNATGAFREEDLSVRNDEGPKKLKMPTRECDVNKPPAWCLGDIVFFGGNAKRENVIAVNLARRVRSFYANQKEGLKYLHEIRISEERSNQLANGHYNLFWNNDVPGEDAPSDELRFLLDRFAAPRRKELLKFFPEENDEKYFLHEYEYEYGVNHKPYNALPRPRRPRTEILHPLFVDRDRAGELKIGHMTDTHVDVRADVYEENLKKAGSRKSFGNYNKNFVALYGAARQASDVILMTGDLIDYGRGHLGVDRRDRLGDDLGYHVDRNWFLFYDLLAAQSRYTRPVYTCLGNHDWRLNPYPPFADGAPSATSLFDDYRTFNRSKPADPAKKAKYDETLREARNLLEIAHGDGHELKYSYSSDATKPLHLLKEDQDPKARAANFKAFLGMVGQKKTLDVKGFPTETIVESVAWYLLAINPFLDYVFPLPGGCHILMLDWAEDEDLLFGVVRGGKTYPYYVWALNEAGDPGQKARNSLSLLQMTLFNHLAEANAKAKVIGMHAPPIGPFPDWTDEDLTLGRHAYDNKDTARGPMTYVVVNPDGTKTTIKGHPLFAIRPKNAPAGMEAIYGSISQHREDFITQAAAAGVRLVLSGHIHRNGLYVAHKPAKGSTGELLIRKVLERDVAGAKPPTVSSTAEGRNGPLYVNTTSAGPRGNYHPRKGESYNIEPGWAYMELASDGTIRQVQFRSRPVPVKAPVAQPEVFAEVG